MCKIKLIVNNCMIPISHWMHLNMSIASVFRSVAKMDTKWKDKECETWKIKITSKVFHLNFFFFLIFKQFEKVFAEYFLLNPGQ